MCPVASTTLHCIPALCVIATVPPCPATTRDAGTPPKNNTASSSPFTGEDCCIHDCPPVEEWSMTPPVPTIHNWELVGSPAMSVRPALLGTATDDHFSESISDFKAAPLSPTAHTLLAITRT